MTNTELRKQIESMWVAYRELWDLNLKKEVFVDQILALIQTQQTELVEGICRLIDEIESRDENKSMEQWKNYKGIRNKIRDNFDPLLLSKLKGKE